MNKLSKITGLFFLLLISIGLNGQNPYIVTPTNTTQVAMEIVDDFHHLISIPTNQLEAHLVSLTDPNIYCASCPNTNLTIQENGPNTLVLNWPAVTNADFYEIAYINLANGNSSTIIESGTSHTLNGIPDGAYAFSISTFSTIGGVPNQSDIVIIVEETPVLLEPGLENCDCPARMPVWYYYAEPKLIWNPTAANTRYTFDLTLEEGSFLQLILRTTEALETDDQPLNFLIECQEGLEYSERSNTFFSIDPDLDFAIHLSYFGLYQLEFEGDDLAMDIVDVNICMDRVEFREGEKSIEQSAALINIFPNPAQDRLWITNLNSSTQPALITIYNQVGQEILQRSSTTEKELININNWPAGLYHIKIKTADKISTQSFIKIN